MDTLKRILVGVGTSPKVVASARAFFLYAIPIAVGLLVGYLNTITSPTYYGLIALATPLIRAIGEGLIDQINKAGQNAINPPPVAGGGSPDLLN